MLNSQPLEDTCSRLFQVLETQLCLCSCSKLIALRIFSVSVHWLHSTILLVIVPTSILIASFSSEPSPKAYLYILSFNGFCLIYIALMTTCCYTLIAVEFIRFILIWNSCEISVVSYRHTRVLIYCRISIGSHCLIIALIILFR